MRPDETHKLSANARVQKSERKNSPTIMRSIIFIPVIAYLHMYCHLLTIAVVYIMVAYFREHYIYTYSGHRSSGKHSGL